MQLLFKQRFFSWFDSFDIFDEAGNTVFRVEGRIAWGHKLEIMDANGTHIGTVRQEALTFLPRFAFYLGGDCVGEIKKEFTFFKPRFTLNCNGWQVEGDWLQWDYRVTDTSGNLVMTAQKELLRWTDTYVIDVLRPEDTLLGVMIVLAIDAAKCASGE